MCAAIFLFAFFLLYSAETSCQEITDYQFLSENKLNQSFNYKFNSDFELNISFSSTNPAWNLPHPDSIAPFARFGYSSLVMLSSSIAGHAYLILRTYKEEDWLSKYSWRSVERSFTLPPKWDQDHWSFNYLIHPYMGSLTYLAWRNRGGSMWSGLVVSGINSVLYEYLLASAIQRPSANDLIITPITGA
nr:DUF3943 domain-containing protein [Bacteroidota bacterium]